MYFNGGTLQILLGAHGNSNGGGPGPSTQNVYREPGHSLRAFSEKCPETTNLTRINKSKQRQNQKNQQTVSII